MDIQYHINMLLGRQLTEIGRCADMVWWIFSKDTEECALHTQCAFRVKHDEGVILTQSSIYYYENDDDADRNDTHAMLFDAQIQKLVQELLPVTITSIQETSTHDLIIKAANNIQIEIFADNPTGYEQWRMFSQGNPSPHLVVYNDHVEYQ